MRQNQAFGDVVAWDLIPKVAREDMALVPGSDPVFGLNTLGAAVTVRTKDGRTAPGTSLSIDGGSFGRRRGTFEHGGSNSKGLSWYLAGNWFREDGWRQYSPSQVRQIFGKVGYTKGKTNISLGFSYADNNLTGNGSTDTRLLAKNYKAVNTIPDITWNRSPSLTLNVSRSVNTHFTISGAAYFRYVRADTTNGDLNNDSFGESLYSLSAADAATYRRRLLRLALTGNSTRAHFPSALYQRSAGEKQPSEKCTGVFTRTFGRQHPGGGSARASWIDGRHNRHSASRKIETPLPINRRASSDISIRTTFRLRQSSFEDGARIATARPSIRASICTGSRVLSASMPPIRCISEGWRSQSRGRYNHAGIRILTVCLSSLRPWVTQWRTNSIASTRRRDWYTPVRLASVYFSYSEANRAPTAIERRADPAQPCSLPNTRWLPTRH